MSRPLWDTGAGLLVEKRWGKPEDIGEAVAMLVRGDLLYASGSVLVLDGGLTLQRLRAYPGRTRTNSRSLAISIYLLETRSPKAPSSSYLFSHVVYMIPVAPGVRSSEFSQSFGFWRSSAS